MLLCWSFALLFASILSEALLPQGEPVSPPDSPLPRPPDRFRPPREEADRGAPNALVSGLPPAVLALVLPTRDPPISEPLNGPNSGLASGLTLLRALVGPPARDALPPMVLPPSAAEPKRGTKGLAPADSSRAPSTITSWCSASLLRLLPLNTSPPRLSTPQLLLLAGLALFALPGRLALESLYSRPLALPLVPPRMPAEGGKAPLSPPRPPYKPPPNEGCTPAPSMANAMAPERVCKGGALELDAPCAPNPVLLAACG
mmetsp:Transcript_56328/g.98891  ORF Transcript_56328/g.98891 Transcript_56328/m.98891 type:complete len:259 (+) Transcript_56328:113-889(+)